MSNKDPNRFSAGERPKPLPETLVSEQAARLRVVADERRLQLMHLISKSPGAQACVCELVDALELSQPTVSHHLRKLVEAGLAERERRGTWMWYSLTRAGLETAARLLPTE